MNSFSLGAAFGGNRLDPLVVLYIDRARLKRREQGLRLQFLQRALAEAAAERFALLHDASGVALP
ncbi:hypothetical protein CUJ84_Chr002173 [Rhizobium leguminosarum]|uniref:Uncharacterized protein n=1 Tax=Rhizobium leguminosarum TaxID=384 RepID=A0A2K9Z2S0_RHILE|nr:hypothetical protein CUJ84_Chr002173 [Rhizobium leguminosarum]